MISDSIFNALLVRARLEKRIHVEMEDVHSIRVLHFPRFSVFQLAICLQTSPLIVALAMSGVAIMISSIWFVIAE